MTNNTTTLSTSVPNKADESARKIFSAWRTHKFRKLLTLNKKIRVTDEIAEQWKETHPEFYEYINYENLRSDQNNKLYYSLNRKSVDQLVTVIDSLAWKDDIFAHEDLPLFAVKAFYDKKLNAFQRSTTIELYWLYQQFGKDNVHTYPLFTKDMEFTIEAKKYLKKYFNGLLLEIPKELLIEKFKDVHPSERCLTVTDITENFNRRAKSYDSNYPFFAAIEQTAPLYREDDKIYDMLVHNQAWDIFIRILIDPNMSFHARLALFSENDLADYQIIGKRLVNERISYVTSLIKADGYTNQTERELTKHDKEFHAPIAAAIPQESVRFYLLQVLRPMLLKIEKQFGVTYPEKSSFADLDYTTFFNHKFLAAKKETLDDLLNISFNRSFFEREHLLFYVILSCHIHANPDVWQNADLDISKLKLAHGNFDLLHKSTAEKISQYPSFNMDSDSLYSVVIESLLEFLSESYKAQRYMVGFIPYYQNIILNVLEVLKLIPEEHFKQREKIFQAFDKMLACPYFDFVPRTIFDRPKKIQEYLTDFQNFISDYNHPKNTQNKKCLIM